MKVLLAFFISMIFGLIFQVPMRSLLSGGLTGALGYASFAAMSQFQPPVLATLLAAIVIGLLSEIFARLYKMPVTVFVTVGFIPLVPGLKAYHTVAALTNGQFSQGLEQGLETIFTAGAIALGISIVSAFSRVIKEQKKTGK